MIKRIFDFSEGWVENVETGERVPLTPENMPVPVHYTYMGDGGLVVYTGTDPRFRVFVRHLSAWERLVRWVRALVDRWMP